MRAYFSIYDLSYNTPRIGFILANLPKGTIPVKTEHNLLSIKDNA